MTRDQNGRRRQPAGAPKSIGGQFAPDNARNGAAEVESQPQRMVVTVGDYVELYGWERDDTVHVSSATVFGTDEDNSQVCLDVVDNLLWREQFTEEELDEHFDIVQATYHEWFGADIDTSADGWEHFEVRMGADVPNSELTRERADSEVGDMISGFANKTDPGTFGHPYIGDEIRHRIDQANARKETADRAP